MVMANLNHKYYITVNVWSSKFAAYPHVRSDGSAGGARFRSLTAPLIFEKNRYEPEEAKVSIAGTPEVELFIVPLMESCRKVFSGSGAAGQSQNAIVG